MAIIVAAMRYSTRKGIFIPHTNQAFSPYYSDLDNSFIYANSTQLAAISLKKTTPSLLYPKNDTVALKADELPAEKKKDTTAKSRLQILLLLTLMAYKPG